MHLVQSNDGDKAFGGQGLQNRPWTFLGFSSETSGTPLALSVCVSPGTATGPGLVLAPTQAQCSEPPNPIFKILFSPSWHLIHFIFILKHCIEILSTLMTEFLSSSYIFVPHLPHPNSTFPWTRGFPVFFLCDSHQPCLASRKETNSSHLEGWCRDGKLGQELS